MFEFDSETDLEVYFISETALLNENNNNCLTFVTYHVYLP